MGKPASINLFEKDLGPLQAVVLGHPRHGSTFSTGSGLSDFNKPIPTYEGFHRYDPTYVWESSDEKRVVRKARSAVSDLAILRLTFADR